MHLWPSIRASKGTFTDKESNQDFGKERDARVQAAPAEGELPESVPARVEKLGTGPEQASRNIDHLERQDTA